MIYLHVLGRISSFLMANEQQKPVWILDTLLRVLKAKLLRSACQNREPRSQLRVTRSVAAQVDASPDDQVWWTRLL